VVGETGASVPCADSDEGQTAGKGPKNAAHAAPPAQAAARRPTVREAYAAARLARMAAHKRRQAAVQGKSARR